MRYDVGRFRRPMRRGAMEQLVSLISLGDGSTLTLDFTTGVLDPRLTFTRGSTGTRINASGFVETMSNNVARFDHDPTTLAPRGLLVEGQVENLCQQGQYCWGTGATNTWARSAEVHVNAVNGTAGASAVARIDGPDGGSLTGTSLFKQAGTATFVRTNINVAVAQSTTYTFSAYVRAPSGGNPYIRLAVFNGGTWLNTTGGTTASGITITNNVGGGSRFNGVPSTAWVRIWVTFTTQVGQTAATIALYPDTDTQNAATMYVWGGQVEAGSGPSSVIPTGASQGTRNSDVCYITNTDYGFTTTGGTYFVEWERGEYDNPTVAGSDCFPFSTDYASGRWLAIFTTPGGTTTSAGSWSVAINQTSTAVAGRNRAAVSYAGWNATTTVTLSANGSSPTSNASMTLGTTPTYLMIGAASQTAPYNGVGLRDILGNRVRRLKYWPFVLPSATLQSITVNTP